MGRISKDLCSKVLRTILTLALISGITYVASTPAHAVGTTININCPGGGYYVVDYPSGDTTTAGKVRTNQVCQGEVTIDPSVEEILGNAFNGDIGLRSIHIPGTVKYIGVHGVPSNAFAGAVNLETVTIGNGVLEIGDSAFYNTAITSIVIPGSVTTIHGNAFFNLSRLTSVTLNEGLETLAWNVFRGTGITSIVIPNSVTSLGTAVF